MKRYIFLICNLFFANLLFSQNTYHLSGDATAIGTDTIRLTLDSPWSNGSVWYKLKHDFTDPFELYGKMFFGDAEDGADGIVFVVQNECLVSGTAGQGIGYQNLPGSSMGIEFDTYQNAGAPANDPVDDHIGIHQNGSVDHLTNLAGPVQMSSTLTNVEDNLWHSFAILYDPSSTTVEIYFEGVLRLSAVIDVASTILGGSPFSYWGFTSATGGNFADNSVVIDSVTAFTLEDTTICPGMASVSLPPLDGFNSSQLATVSASSEESGFGASNAIDSDFGTRWSSDFSDPQWITIDLGSPMDIHSVALFWQNAFGLEYYIQTSNDNATWTDQFHETAGNGGTDAISIPITNARYVRMLGIQRGTIYGYSLWEFQVFTQQQYAWSPNDGTVSDTSSSSPTFTPTQTTTYTLTIPDPCLGSTEFDYTVFVDCVVLPVEMMTFDGDLLENRYSYLHWITLSEIDNDYFQVQRSENGIDWINIGTVDGFGNTQETINYHFEDFRLDWNLPGYYYRLKQVDYDGSAFLSNMIYIPLESSGGLMVFPNPTTQLLTITNLEEGCSQLEIFDMKGSRIKEISLNSHSELLTKVIDVSNLASGAYILKAGSGFVRFLKE